MSTKTTTMTKNYFPPLKLSILIVAGVFFPDSLHAQTAKSTIEEVIVREQPLTANPLLPLSTINSIQLLSTEDIERTPSNSVFETLGRATGVYFIQSGAKVPSKVAVRGDENHAFILDGAYLPDFLASRVLEVLPEESLKDIEVIRSSSTLSSAPLTNLSRPSGAANNGFIRLNTHTFNDVDSHIKAKIQQYDGFELSGLYNFNNIEENHYLMAAGEYFDTSGPEEKNLFSNNSGILIKTGFSTNKLSFHATALHGRSEFGFQRGSSDLIDKRRFLKRSYSPISVKLLAVNSQFQWNSKHSTQFNSGYTYTNGMLIQRRYNNNSLKLLQNKNKLINASISHIYTHKNYSFSSGVDFIRWYTPTGQLNYEGYERKENIFGLFLQGQSKHLNNALSLDLSVRADKIKIIKGIDYFKSGSQPKRPATVNGETLPHAYYVSTGVTFDLSNQWNISGRAFYSRQAKREDIASITTEALKGEERIKYELGISHRGTESFRSAINFFAIETTNEALPLDYIDNNDVIIALYKNHDTKRSGVELSAHGEFSITDKVNGGYRTSLTYFFEKPSPISKVWQSQPDSIAETEIYFKKDSWETNLLAKNISDITSNRFTRCATSSGKCPQGITPPFLSIGDFTTMDLSLSYSLNNANTKLTIALKNLTDAHYETRLGYPNIGREVSFEIKVGI